LYDYCGGDPVNGLDADGRCGKAVINLEIQRGTGPVGAIGDAYGISSLSNFRDNANYMANMALYKAPNIAVGVDTLAGIPLGIADLNIFNSANSTSANGFLNYSINGINMSDTEVTRMSQLAAFGLHISQRDITPLANPSHGIGFDIIRACGQWSGATDITSLRAADMLNASGSGNINIVGYSNGTEMFAGAMPYVDLAVRARISFQGFGGQQYIDQNIYCLKSARNFMDHNDQVTYLTPSNLLNPYIITPSNGSFRWNNPFQAHSFKNNYAPYIIPVQ
jgi:hypothetical protein